ncbi:MAG TPA: transglutaminase domain-containing protein, partial [Planctomycetota bacterium]|nr:transglutaminase domain-containing protein [Planctomycetota bacterium]
MRASALIVSSLCWLRAIAADPSPAVVCDVRVISPHVADVSSLAAWRASTITPEMSPQQQAEAVFATVVGFVHHEWYVREWLGGPEACVHDPIKTFNVYGYGHCCCTAAHVAALARSLGMPARGCSTPGHTLAEVSYDGAWHMLDPAFIDYFPRADGVIASVDELTAGISAWLAGHPEMADPEAQRRFMRGGGWRSGPAILTHGRFLDDNGWLPERGHGWYSMLRQFGDPAQVRVYENGTTVGYRVDNRLRHGERLILP